MNWFPWKLPHPTRYGYACTSTVFRYMLTLLFVCHAGGLFSSMVERCVTTMLAASTHNVLALDCTPTNYIDFQSIMICDPVSCSFLVYQVTQRACKQTTVRVYMSWTKERRDIEGKGNNNNTKEQLRGLYFAPCGRNHLADAPRQCIGAYCGQCLVA